MGTKKEDAAVKACEQIIIRVSGNPVLGHIFGDMFSRGCNELCDYIAARREENGKPPMDKDDIIAYLRAELETRPEGLVIDGWDMVKSRIDGGCDDLNPEAKVYRLGMIMDEACEALLQLGQLDACREDAKRIAEDIKDKLRRV